METEEKKKHFALALMNEIYVLCLMCDEENRRSGASGSFSPKTGKLPGWWSLPPHQTPPPTERRPSEAAEAQKQITF